MFGGRRAVSQPDTSQQRQVPDALSTLAAADTTRATPSSPLEPDLDAPLPTDTTPVAGAMAPSATDGACDKRNSDASVGETAIDRTSQATTAAPSIRVMSADVEKDSQKVRLLYDSGDVTTWEGENRLSPLGEQNEPSVGQASEDVENDRSVSLARATPMRFPTDQVFFNSVPELQPSVWASPRSTSSLSTRHDASHRREHELAGGIEDWEDVNGADVDRYGFISPRRPESRAGTPTELKSAQFAARRRNVLIKRDLSGLSSSQLSARSPSRKVSARSLNTQNSERSVRSRRSTRSAIRQASNYLPHNRNRRWMDEAGDMLTMAPSLQDMLEDARIEKISEAIKKKETERSEKWRKMAKVVKRGKDGEGMEFEFDVKNPKLIERTWKGIPDRWRASAWYSFLATSAKNSQGSATEEQIMADFHRFQQANSPDDVQIDLDVPRTINRHIMFRRRYRGGQRLLFRVLHALSLYFPDVGYVQGMASLAATLLCYFDEERCFVMLVRMWQYRGLEQLYQPGFEGLMAALKELETEWLGGKDMAKKMVSAGNPEGPFPRRL
jgi:Rab-GTPase-TBC domain-containing protein